MTDALTAPATGPEAGISPTPSRSARRREQLAALWPWIAVSLATAVSLVLRWRSPLFLVEAPHDDSLFARMAGNLIDGWWLGSYDQVILTKGPGYPLFVAVAYDLHLPLKLAEHTVHLAAAAVTAVAVARILRSRSAGVIAYALLALNPAYLGATAARLLRDPLYGSLGLLLAGGTLLLLTYVPALAAARARVAVVALVAGGVALGVVAAGYYLVREERSWIAPTLALLGVTGVLTWPRDRRWTARNAVVLGAATVLAGATGAAAISWAAGQNERAYGTSVIADLADGEIARAYGEWQRVEAGRERRYVPVNAAQRRAVYEVSPAAAEMQPALDGSVIAWITLGCNTFEICDDYAGAYFVWAMRDAAAVVGHGDSGAASQRYFGRVADDIGEACATGELRCTARPVGPLPPLSRIDGDDVLSSVADVTTSFLAYDVGEPDRRPSGGASPAAWELLTHPLRGSDDESAYVAAEAGRLRHQEIVAALTDLYRWGARLGAVVALVGLAAGVATRAGRRNPAALVLVATTLVATLSRVVLVALIDATAYPAAGATNYILPGTDFLVLFVFLGCWTLVSVVRAR